MNIKETYGSKDLEKEYGRLTFGQALWSHRKCEEISQKQFAISLGISSQSLCDIEKRPEKFPHLKELQKLQNR